MATSRSTGTPNTNRCIAETVVNAERKTFYIGRYENPRGAYLRVTETGSHRFSNTIVIPLCGVADMICALDSMLQASPQESRTAH